MSTSSPPTSLRGTVHSTRHSSVTACSTHDLHFLCLSRPRRKLPLAFGSKTRSPSPPAFILIVVGGDVVREWWPGLGERPNVLPRRPPLHCLDVLGPGRLHGGACLAAGSIGVGVSSIFRRHNIGLHVSLRHLQRRPLLLDKPLHELQPQRQENKDGLQLLKAAIEKACYTGKVVIGMDVPAFEFFSEDKTYDLNFMQENDDDSNKISGDSLQDLYKSFVSEYPIVSIEDPFDQDDWTTYAKLSDSLQDLN